METIIINNPLKVAGAIKKGKFAITCESYADVSDGYHTVEELYDHRITLYIALCRKIQDFLFHGDQRNYLGDDKKVWRAKLHSDGTSYAGWFLLAIDHAEGEQISYHVPLARWNETDFAQTFEKAPCRFDGHTSADVIERLKLL